MAGEEYRDYLILDGVGGTSQVKDGRNPLAGSFDWADRNKGAKRSDVSVEMGGSNTRLGGGVATLSGERGFKYGRKSMPTGGAGVANALGYGVEDNARHAIFAIADLPQLPDTINLIGWSRGAVTALVIANMLYDPSTTEGLLRQIKINVFAVDPVAGDKAGTKDGAESRRLIPPNVKNYLAVLNKGENRNTFSPQDLGRVIVVNTAASNVVFLTFPGEHDSCAQNSNPNAKEVSDIAWSLAFRFLDHFGTRITPPGTTIGDEAAFARYCAITVKGEQYAGVKQKGFKQFLIGKGFGSRSMTNELEAYTLFSDYFVNEHHRMLFERLLPQLYGWLFRPPGPAQTGLASRKIPTASAMGQEIAGAAAMGNHVLESLSLLGVEASGAVIALPGPGSGMDGKLNAFRQTGSLVTMGVVG
jgi:hypothetical protein